MPDTRRFAIKRMGHQVFAASATLVLAFGLAGDAASAATPSSDDVSRGAYLVAIAACAGCHTPRGADGPGPALSGGRAFGSGVHAILSANITPDPGTGIGAWSGAQIATAIREGLRPDGTRIGPPMPQIAYRAMRDEDVEAIVAYLRSVPPVVHAVPREHRAAAVARVTPPATIAGEDPVARGRYLANAVTHCTECHTPASPDTVAFVAHLDAGGRVFPTARGPLVAPSITPASLQRFSDAELAAIITKGRRPDGSPLEGPMPVAAYAHLTPDDVRALVAYLRR